MNTDSIEKDGRISMKPVEKKSLYLKISDAIYRYIKVNNLQAGDKLPSERDMSSMLQTSRNSVREALRILEDRGLIYVKTGSGAFINNPYGENKSLTIQLTNCSLKEIEELQSILDHKAVQNALERATDQEKEEMVATATEMVKLASDRIFSHVLDDVFHKTFYRAGRNSALEQFVRQIRSYRYVLQEGSNDENDEKWLPTVHNHLELAQALKDRNLSAAIQAVDDINEHGFEMSRKNMSEY